MRKEFLTIISIVMVMCLTSMLPAKAMDVDFTQAFDVMVLDKSVSMDVDFTQAFDVMAAVVPQVQHNAITAQPEKRNIETASRNVYAISNVQGGGVTSTHGIRSSFQ